MITLEDARGRMISLSSPPRRIVSLVPSQTELLASLGLDDEVVGITRFCVHPQVWRNSKMIVGGTKLLRIDRIHELRPDLIFANLEENSKEDVERIEDAAPVFVTNVRTLEEAIDMIESVALLVDRVPAGARIAAAITGAFEDLSDVVGIGGPATGFGGRTFGVGGPGTAASKDPRGRGKPAVDEAPSLRAAYLIWRDPYMSVGADTFIHDMMARGGFDNVFDAEKRYPQVSEGDIIDANPDVVFLPTEPFPFLEKHMPEIEAILPGAKIELVDGQLFSWYGSRLIHTPDYLLQLRRNLGLT